MLKDFWFAGADRRYWRGSAVMTLAYAATLLVSQEFAPTLQPTALRVFAVLSPVLPLLGFTWLEYRRIRATDELRQRMELEAGMLTLAICVPLLLGIGLLDEAGLIEADVLASIALLVTVYLLAQLWAHRRYR